MASGGYSTIGGEGWHRPKGESGRSTAQIWERERSGIRVTMIRDNSVVASCGREIWMRSLTEGNFYGAREGKKVSRSQAK